MQKDFNEDSKLNRLLRWRKGEMPGPWQMVVFPTNRCNLKCSICWQRGVEEEWGKLDHSRELPDGRLLELVDESAAMGVREWTIGGGGDPMVRGDLVMNMCSRIRELHMNGGIFTNGTMLQRPHLEHLVDIGWQRLDLSLDGPTEEINDDIRSNGSFKRVLASIHLLKDICESKERNTPELSLHAVLTKNNLEYIEDMIALCSDLGIRHLGLSLLHVQSDQCVHHQLTPNQWKRLPAILKQADQVGKQFGVGTNASTILKAKMLREKRALTEYFDRDVFTTAGCYEPFLTANVVAEGFVGPCCAFWDETAGNLHKQSLEDIWVGEWFQNFRQRMLARDFADFCEYCPSHFVWMIEETRQKLRSVIAESEDQRPQPLDATLWKRLRSRIRQEGLLNTFQRGTEWLTNTVKHKLK